MNIVYQVHRELTELPVRVYTGTRYYPGKYPRKISQGWNTILHPYVRPTKRHRIQQKASRMMKWVKTRKERRKPDMNEFLSPPSLRMYSISQIPTKYHTNPDSYKYYL